MNGISLAVDALAVRRLTRLVTSDAITEPMRRAAFHYNEKLGELVQCPSCTSVWAAGAISVTPRPVRYALALSEAAILLGQAAGIIERLNYL